MSKTVKVLVLLASLWPLVYTCIFFAAFIGMIFLAASPGHGAAPAGKEAPQAVMYGFAGLFALALFTMLWNVALMIFYIVDVFRSPRIASDNMRALWALVIFFGGLIGMPVYWYLNIWRDPEPASPSAAPSPVGG